MKSTENAWKYKDIQDIEDFGECYFDTGAGAQLAGWRFGSDANADPQCTTDNNDGQWVLLARREGNTNIWHKLMELWQALLSVHALLLASDPSTGRPYLLKEDISKIQFIVEDDQTDNPWESLWTMVTGNEPIRLSQIQDARCIGNVILPVAGSSSPFWALSVDDVEHERCTEQFLVEYLI